MKLHAFQVSEKRPLSPESWELALGQSPTRGPDVPQLSRAPPGWRQASAGAGRGSMQTAGWDARKSSQLFVLLPTHLL